MTEHWCTFCQGVNAHNCQFNPNIPRQRVYVTNSTAHPAQAGQVPAWTTEQITAVARPIAMAIAENCRTAPQLVFPHLFLGLKDLLTSTAPQQAEPMFWVRLRSDGMYEGPIHNAQIERVRIQSGAWTPLYLGALPSTQKKCTCGQWEACHICANTNPPQQAEAVYVEARECDGCGHCGINDSPGHTSACLECEWSGPSPEEDLCPGCGLTGVMTSACAKCGSRTHFLADAQVLAAPQQAEAVPPSNLIDPGSVVSFAVDRWLAEVANRPLVNKNRRTLDDTWRQVIRRFGGDPDVLLGPPHDELVAIAQQKGQP